MSILHAKQHSAKKLPVLRRQSRAGRGEHARGGSVLDTIRLLHQTAGNRAVGRMLQAKLKVGKPGDKFEQEADRTAEAVMSMPEPKLQRQQETGEEELQMQPVAEEEENAVQRQPAEEEEPLQKQPEEEEEVLESKETSGGTPTVAPRTASKINAMRGGGHALQQSARAFFEPRFGADFRNVRVHRDDRAAETTKAVNAKAFTVGRDIAFGDGRYAPETHEGKKLLTHELTHVVQQNGRKPETVQRIKENEQKTYVVRKGDTLRKIALEFGVTVDKLTAANRSKVKIWETPGGQKIVGFDAGEKIIMQAKASDEKAGQESELGFFATMEEAAAGVLESGVKLLGDAFDLIQNLTPGEEVAKGSENSPAELKEDSAACTLTTFSGSNFTGKTVVADVQFLSALNRINKYAVENNVDIYVTSSFRTSTNVPGAIVKPAKTSNHLAGHAIDMNVKYGDNKKNWCNSTCLKGEIPKEVIGFIDAIRKDPGLRWGGDFSKTDPVHIDDHLNKNKSAWKARVKATQEARKSGCG